MLLTFKQALSIIKFNEDADNLYFRFDILEGEGCLCPFPIYINIKNLYNKIDIKKLKVKNIEPYFSYDGYEGMRFNIVTDNNTIIKICGYNPIIELIKSLESSIEKIKNKPIKLQNKQRLNALEKRVKYLKEFIDK